MNLLSRINDNILFSCLGWLLIQMVHRRSLHSDSAMWWSQWPLIPVALDYGCTSASNLCAFVCVLVDAFLQLGALCVGATTDKYRACKFGLLLGNVWRSTCIVHEWFHRLTRSGTCTQIISIKEWSRSWVRLSIWGLAEHVDKRVDDLWRTNMALGVWCMILKGNTNTEGFYYGVNLTNMS